MRRRSAVSCLAALAAALLASCAQQPRHSAALDAAVAQYLRMEVDSAAVAFAQVVRTEPRNAEALAWLADAKRRQGQPDSAVALARAALALAPGQGFAHFVLGATYDPIKSGWQGTSRDSSLAHYSAAARATPPDADGWIGLRLYASIAGDTAGVRSALQGMHQAGFLTPAGSAWGRWLLDGLPPNAVLLTNGDMDTFPCEIVQTQGTRPDVVIVNLSLLNVGEYARNVARLYGLPLPPAVQSGALDSTGAVQKDGRTWYVSELITDLWRQQALAGTFPRPLYAAGTVASPHLAGPDAAFMHTHLAGPRWHIAPPADSVADFAALAASVRGIDPAAFAGPMASASDKSPVRRVSADMLGLNVANTARVFGMKSMAAGDSAGMQLALEKIEGLRRSVALGDSLERPLAMLREQFGHPAK